MPGQQHLLFVLFLFFVHLRLQSSMEVARHENKLMMHGDND